eukprot:COSAG06_NODE_1423_length_9499_cov_65.511967_10_plen_74_part_00
MPVLSAVGDVLSFCLAGRKNMDGELVAPLAAPLRWAVALEAGGSVRIAGGGGPPRVSEAVRKEDARRSALDDY